MRECRARESHCEVQCPRRSSNEHPASHNVPRYPEMIFRGYYIPLLSRLGHRRGQSANLFEILAYNIFKTPCSFLLIDHMIVLVFTFSDN